MTSSYAHLTAQHNLTRAALRCIAADYYADDANPHADADSQHAAELLALAARDLVAAVDALPEGEQPIGWGETPSDSATVQRVRAVLAGLQKSYAAPPEDEHDQGWRAGLAEAIGALKGALKTDQPQPDATMLAGRDLLTAMGGLAECAVIPLGEAANYNQTITEIDT